MNQLRLEWEEAFKSFLDTDTSCEAVLDSLVPGCVEVETSHGRGILASTESTVAYQHLVIILIL